jgi:antitoxin MazE
MRAQVKKWGNSASVRIPASVMAAAAIEVDQLVDIREDNGRIVIEPLRAPVYDLDALLAAMTPETFPEDADFGAPVGNETW